MMPYTGNDWQPNRNEAYATITADQYGQEHDETVDELVDVENGVRKHWADKFREIAEKSGGGGYTTALMDAAQHLDPYSGVDGPDGAFARTLAQGEPGTVWPS